MSKKVRNTAKNLAKILKYTKQTQTAMTGIDELNVISDTSSSGLGIDDLFPVDNLAKSVKDIDLALEDYDNGMSKSTEVFKEIEAQWMTFFGKLSEKIYWNCLTV